MQRGISIHIGVNHAPRMRPILSRSEEAAWKMAGLAFEAGYHDIHLLRGAAATREAVGALLERTARALQPGQTLFVSFSGHGSRKRDRNGDERDRWDETWCLHDRELVDDDLANYWKLLARDTRVLVVSETCFGGGGMRTGDGYGPSDEPGPDAPPRKPVYRSLRGVGQTARPQSTCIATPPKGDDDIQASLLLLAAAAEPQHAKESVYTDRLLAVWKGGMYRHSFCDLHREVCGLVRGVGNEQDPQILMLGTPDLEFPLEVAFHLEEPLADGPAPGGPVTGGPATGGPATGGPATGGPATGGRGMRGRVMRGGGRRGDAP